MADITFAQLNTALGDTVFSASGANITIDCQKLMGETSIALSDEKVAELLARVLDAAADAQTAYNANPANTVDLAAYPGPISGTAIDDGNGGFYVNSSYTVNVAVPLQRSATSAAIA